ncbi:MAG: hypothetical protein P1U89_24840 [Verrucomicrobiales bacterium]|nr:hypothetical protein [Verrucomicrobiales bacterium]
MKKLAIPSVFLTAMVLLCSGTHCFGEPLEIEPSDKPYSHGNYLVITCHRVEGAGKFPISYSLHEVTSINGKKLEKPLEVHVEYIDSFHIPGNPEVMISGYFTKKQVGQPDWPQDSPEAKYMQYSQSLFRFIDVFIASGVRAPEEEKKRFEKEVSSKRKQ